MIKCVACIRTFNNEQRREPSISVGPKLDIGGRCLGLFDLFLEWSVLRL